MAVISGLSNASVYRLKKSWAKIPKAELTKWNETKEIMSREQNYLYFRQQIEGCTPPCIPYLYDSPPSPFFLSLLPSPHSFRFFSFIVLANVSLGECTSQI